MSIKSKIFMFVIVVLSIIFITSSSGMVKSVSFALGILLVVSMSLSNYILSKKLIKKIEKEKIEHVKVKDSNKLMAVVMLFPIYSLYRAIQSRYEVFKGGNNSSIDILGYINSFEKDEKVILLVAILVIIYGFIAIGQMLLNPCIVSKDKIIFSNGAVVDIDKIEELEYKNSFYRKNKKIIKISKGFTDRDIIMNTEDFNKVKMLLECKS